MNYRNIIPKIGLIVAIISGLATAGGVLNEITKPMPALTARIYQDTFYLPPDYKDKILEYYKKIDWQKIYDSIDVVDENGDSQKKRKLTNDLFSTMIIPFAAPFDHGLEAFKTKAFVYVANNGEAIAKDVYVDFPEKVLLMVEDDKGDLPHTEGLISRYKIPSIRQGGHYKIWAWAKSEKFNKYDINIGNESQVAKIDFGELYYGKTGKVLNLLEENIFFVVAFATMLVIYIIYSLSIVISYLFDEK